MAGPALPRVHLDEVLRAGFHGSGLPWAGLEPPWAGPGTPHVEAGPPGGLSLRASQGARTPLPAWEGVRRRHVSLWARPLTSGSGADTCPTGASLPPEANPPDALNAGGGGVRSQSRAWAAL